MYKKVSFKKKVIATAVAAAALSSLSGVAFAQDDVVEEVLVTGIRGSLQRSMDVKRDSQGVVDAISAEDIGKFPDTNLAESLQRITGVSISRNNGEGSQVTVRGFGAGNNMVTLNGRMMPAGSTFAGQGGGSRAFDFGNLASEGVSSVEVYKTGKASIATGGIGATINILTAKPLDSEGIVASVGVKAVMDTTNRVGRDVTPELSGLFSYTNDNATFGVGLSVSHQERDSSSTGALVNNWNIGIWDDVANPNRLWNNPDATVINPPDQGQLYARPNDLRYIFNNAERVRDNAQLTLQFSPMENFTATADYTYANNETKQHNGEITNWMQTGGRTQLVEFDNQTVATPIYIRETYEGGIDEGFAQTWNENTNTLDSIGINLDYQVTDSLNITLDVHDSEFYSRGTGPYGTGSLSMGLGAPTITEREWWFDTELPTWSNVYDDTLEGKGANGNGIVDIGDVSSTMLRLRNRGQKTNVTQVKLDGTYSFDDGRFDFGLETREMKSRTLNQQTGNIALGNWNAGNPGEFGDLVQPFDLPGEFNDFPTRSDGYGFIADPIALYEHALGQARYADNISEEMAITADNVVIEDTTAVYFQVTVNGELGGMPFDVLAGFRYEVTDVESQSIAAQYKTTWEDNNDLAINVDTSKDSIVATADNSYDYLLPSLDFSLNITDDLKARFSFGKTIARAGLNSLGVSASGFGAGGGSTGFGAQPSATASNPGLLPLESTNVDLSLEWYYNEASYVSAGFFQKNVVNFIGTKQVNQSLLNIRNVTAGPRAQEAIQDLVDSGLNLDDTNLYGQLVFNAHSNDAELLDLYGPVFSGEIDQVDFLANHAGWDVVSNDSDPLYIFSTSTPDNAKAAKIYGAEFAVQHFFGESGFGVQANYTIVRGDVGIDDNADPGTSQFALQGLSDTANLIAMYERDGLQARISYNWRDTYLRQANSDGSNNPIYVEAYSQIDINVSYEITDGLTVFVEGLNVTGENSRSFERNFLLLNDMFELGPRYQVGARYTF